MAQPATADERIALSIESRADVSGFRAARAETSALSREAKATERDLSAVAITGIASQRGLAAATHQAAEEQQRITLTTEQSRAMWSRAGGDYTRFLDLVRQHVAQERALTQETIAATAAQRAQAQTQATSIGGGAGSGAAASVGRVAAEVDKIPARARTAANALSSIAFAASASGTGLQGMAVAAGSAAAGIAGLTTSARIAAAASGIGALVTVAVTAIALMDRMTDSAKASGSALSAALGDLADKAFEARRQMVELAFAEQTRRVAELEQSRRFLGVNVGPEILREGERLEALTADREAVFREFLDRRRKVGRDAAEQERHDQEEDANRAKSLLEELTKSILDQYEKRTLSADAAARAKVEREFAERRDEIATLRIQEDTKTTLIAGAARDRAEKLLAINLDAAARENEIRDKLLRDQQDKYDRALDHVRETSQAALHAAIAGGESFIQAATRTFLTPIVRRLEALAIDEGIEALASFAFLDFAGAARHAAVAAAAIEGARRVAGIAGIGAGGGGSAPLGGPTASSRDPREAGSNVTVIVQTINPFSRDVIGETSYQLERAGILKTPIYAPPVSGIRAA